MSCGLLAQNGPGGLTPRVRRLLGAITGGPIRLAKAVGRGLERRLARRISERYADEITQFASLAREMRELNASLTARLDKQEGFQWDHLALSRRLAGLEDHVTTVLGELERAG